MADKKDRFSKASIFILAIFIAGMVVYNYFYISPKGEISSGLIVLVSFLLILTLSESFDNFSVGRIFTLSKSLKEKESTILKLNKINNQLMNMINISLKQSQSNNNFIGYPPKLNLFSVTQADEKEVDEYKKEEVDQAEEISEISSSNQRQKLDFRKVENLGLQKYVEKFGLAKYSLVKQAKLVANFNGIDPVSEIYPIYDGYIKTDDSEIFIEVKKYPTSMLFEDRLYLMLSKIYHYKKVKDSNVYLALVFIDIHHETSFNRSLDDTVSRINKNFEPSINDGLLRISCFDVEDNEMPNLFKEDRRS